MNHWKLGAIGLLAFAAGCSSGGGGGGGSGSGEVSCTISAGIGSIVSTVCQEYPPSEAVQAMSACNSAIPADAGAAAAEAGLTESAQFSSGPCTRTNAVGGCSVTSGGATATTWYYQPFTSDLVMQACSSAGGSYIAP